MRIAGEGSPVAVAVPNAAERAASLFLTPRRPAYPRLPPSGSTPLEISTRAGLVRGWTVGSGPRVLCVHGWEGDSVQFARWVPALVESGFSVTALDLPAHGASEGHSASAVKFAHALLDAAPSLGPLDGVIGHSLGCAGVGIALSEGLQVGRACLLAPVAEPMPFARAVARAAQLDAETFTHFVRRIEELVGRSFDSLDVPRLLANIGVEVLVLHDPADGEVPFSHGQRYAEQVPGARLVALEDAGHRTILKDPRAIEHAVRFIAGVAARASHG